jgi:ABC-type polysaccharide/polyol phosphate transport system ATPase subunit
MFDVEFHNVSKRYMRPAAQARRGHPQSLRERLRGWWEPRSDFWALRDVSFHVERGEALGIIGANGAGKSTILKLLTRITAPTAGEIAIRGRLSALIEVSSGFHPELTGRENVYLNGVTFGMTRREVSGKLPSIIDFSGVGDFIDVPVKRYSSGMYLRLGFSIAAHLNPDILLLDEVLAVGDVAFQSKCLSRIQDLRRAGRTIVFISHDLAAVERLCDRALLLSHGTIVCEGNPQDVTLEYQRSTHLDSSPPAHAQQASREIECTGFSYESAAGSADDSVRTGGAMIVKIDYVAHEIVSDAVFNVYLYWPSGYLCTQLTTGETGITVAKGPGCVHFFCPIVNLRPGLFLVDIAVERYPEVIDWRHRCATLRVNQGPVILGDLHMQHEHCILEGLDNRSQLGGHGPSREGFSKTAFGPGKSQ